MTPATETVERNLLDLHVPVDPDGTSAAVAPLAWCVTKALMAEVEAKEFKNPHLLVLNRVKKSHRSGKLDWTDFEDKSAVLVPLSNAMTYVSFTAPGENELHAFVVDIANKQDAKYARKFVHEVEKWRGFEFGSCLRDHDNGIAFEKLPIPMLRRTSESVAVNVPAEMFAPPPKEWKKKIVRRFFSSAEVDQCHFRKHFLISAPLALLLAPVLYVLKTLMTVVIYAVGGRGLALRVFKHPLEWPTALTSQAPNLWFAPFEDKDHEDKFSVWSVLNLPVLGALALLLWGLDSIGWLAVLKIVGTMVVVAGLGVAAAMFLTSDTFLGSWRGWRESAQEKDHARNIQALESMLCETNLPANSIKDLPREKRTFELRFYDFKTKVCKPFAR